MSHIDINDLVKRYASIEVIHSITTHIDEGEFAVLVGPSGCGKSTLLRMIAGLEEINGGSISIGGRVINNLPPKDRDIAMVFQNYALYPHMTVAQNMGYSLRIRRIDKSEIATAVESAASILGLSHLLDRYPAKLSGGQRQRVAMGRAIVRQPSVFLFDEPLSNLDAKLRVKMRAEIRTLQQRLGTTTVYVTHDQIEAMTMADKIIVLEDGHISQVGTPLELYDRPSNRFVATFIGSPSMNILSGIATTENMILLSDGQTLNVAHSLDSQQPVEVGIRPENLSLADSGDVLNATVALVESTGSETLINCQCSGVEFVASVKDRVNYRAGDNVIFGIDTSKAHLFSTETGARITT